MTSAFLRSALLAACLAQTPVHAAEILVNTDSLAVTVGGQSHDFGGKLLPPERLADGTARFRIAGDLVLAAGDTLRGTGSVPAVILVGNDVHIMPAAGTLPAARIDFSGVGSQSGAGGAGGRPGGTGGAGGRGGDGGSGGTGGVFGVGGLIYTPNTPLPISIVTPGTPAGPGTGGGSGTAGKPGREGARGFDGLPGFGNPGSSAGSGATRPGPGTGLAGGGSGGAATAPTVYIPPIFWGNPVLRELFLPGFGDEGEFREQFYNGRKGAAGEPGESQPPISEALQATAFGRHGGGARQLAAPWSLAGGSSGGSGSGGSGGAGGAGGGGGAGGAGGQGEFAEPFPTSALDLGATVVDEGAAYLIEKAVDAYLRKKGIHATLNIFRIPTVDIGATGGRGGTGAAGFDGKSGGTGGPGGASGGGGGALLLEAKGRIIFHGTADASGGDGTGGTAGENGGAFQNLIRAGGGSGLPTPGFGMSAILSPFGALASLIDGPAAGRGGTGGEGVAGGGGGQGFPGGSGGGGSGGTLIFKGSQIEGSGNIILRGGSHDHENPDLHGADGRLYLATNQVAADSPLATTLAAIGIGVTSASPPDSTTGAGSTAPNPFLAGSPETPAIPGLLGGAEAFGVNPPPGDALTLIPDIISATPANAVMGAVRYDVGPPPFDDIHEGYDLVVVFNPRTSTLDDTRFGVNVQFLDDGAPAPDPAVADFSDGLAPYHSHPVTLGGFARDPEFGGSGVEQTATLGGYDVFFFLVPEDTANGGLNFSMTATSGGIPFRIESQHFVNGEILYGEFDPDVDVYDSEWVGPAEGGPDGFWNDPANWSTFLNGTPVPLVVPNNDAGAAFNVGINYLDAVVSQDTVISIDRLGIGEDNGLIILDDRTLVIEKFNVRPEAGMIDNAGLIRLESTGSPTSLRFSGSDILLTGGGTLRTTANSNNLIGGIRTSDSLIHDIGHTIIASGGLGGDRLGIINRGTIRGVDDPAAQILVIDPVGGPGRSAPGFLNEGVIRPAETTSEIRFADGYFRNTNPLGIDFERGGTPSDQLLSLHGSRLESTGETLLLDDPAFAFSVTGVSRLENLDFTLSDHGVFFSENADLTLDGVTFRLPETDLFTRTVNSLGTTISYDLTLRNSTLRGGTFGFIDTGDIFSWDDDPADLEDEILREATFFAALEGTVGGLRDTRIEGNFHFNADVEVMRYYGFPFADFDAFFDYDHRPGYDHVTLRVFAETLGLGGTIENDGLVEFRSSSASDRDRLVLIDGNVTLAGNGAWGGWSEGIPPRILFQGTDPDENDFLRIGAGQTVFRSEFDTDGLRIENDGLLFDFSTRSDDSELDGPDLATALEAVRAPVFLTNRGVARAFELNGGGTIDNTDGTFALSERTFILRNARIRGGEVVQHFHKDLWTDDDFINFEETAGIIPSFNTAFENCRISSRRFDPSLTLEDLLIDGPDYLGGAGLIWFGGSTTYTTAAGTEVSAPSLVLDDVHLASHAVIPETRLAGTLKLDPGVALVASGNVLVDEGFAFDISAGSPGGIALSRGIGGAAGNLILPAELPVLAVGEIGQDTLFITNEGDLRLYPPFTWNAPPVDMPTMIFDAPGDATSPVGFRNTGTIRAMPPSGDFFDSGHITFLPGHYDNTGGEILIDDELILEGALIDGGVIRAVPESLGLGGISGTQSHLRNVHLEVAEIEWNMTFENCTFVTQGDATLSQYGPGAGATVIGNLTLQGAGPDAPMFFESFPQVGDPSRDRVIIKPNTYIELSGFAQSQIRSLENEGVLLAESPVFTTPLVASGESLDLSTAVPAPGAPIGEVVTLAELGITELEVNAASTIRNRGFIGGDTDGYYGEAEITEAVIDNAGGTIRFAHLGVSDSLIRNEGGILAANDGYFYNSIVYGGTLEGTWQVFSAGGYGDFGDESVTTLQDIAFDEVVLWNEGAFLLITGSVGGPDSYLDNTRGEVSVAGSASVLELGDGMVNNGRLSLNSGTVRSHDFDSTPGSTIIGNGTIDHTTPATVAGTISPGFSAGLIEFTGDLVLAPTSVIEIEVGAGGHDEIVEAGTAPLALAGTLYVSLLDGFVPSPADTFTVIRSNQPLAGAFGTRTSGERVEVTGYGSCAIYYGSGSPYDPNALVLADFSIAPAGGVLFVNHAATGLADGTSWTDAFPRIQDALVVAQPGDEVWIANGTYFPGTIRTISLVIKNGVRLHGGFAGTETHRDQSDPLNTATILSGDIGSDNSLILATATNCGPGTVIEGLILRDSFSFGLEATGSSLVLRHCIVENHRDVGVAFSGGSPVVDRCVFRDNGVVGLTLFAEGGLVTGCLFTDNRKAMTTGGGTTLLDSTFATPTFLFPVTALTIGGDGAATVRRCEFTGNTTHLAAGAVAVNSGDPVTFTDCRFTANAAASHSGAIFNQGQLTLVNCHFSGNKAGAEGGAIRSLDATLTAINCTFTGNDAGSGGGAIHHENSGISLINTVLWNNRSGGSIDTPPASINDSASAAFTHCLAENLFPSGPGNLDGTVFTHAPQFRTPVDPAAAPTAAGDLRVLSTSPVIDAGENSANPEPTDLAGNPRLIGPIDLGAYEYRANLPDPGVFSGSLDVVQFGPGNTPAEVHATLTPSSSPGILVNHAQTNRADYWLAFPSADDFHTGVLMTTVAQNGRTNDGTFGYATTATQNVGPDLTIATFRAGVWETEFNINVSFAWFPYDRWLGAVVTNSVNNGPMTTLTGTAGLVLGTHFIDNGSGIYTLDLRSLDPAATPDNGVLLVNGAKNEANYALSRSNANGTFTIFCHDNSVDAAAYERDPVSFVYLPFAATADTELVAAARIADVSGTPQTLAGTGPFTLTKAGTGRWFLEIAGHDAATGTLLLSPEGGGTLNVDNIVSHQWDPAAGHWIIESRDLPGLGLQNGTNGEPMFSFAFFDREPAGVLVPPDFATLFPGLDPAADANGNGHTNFEIYAAGYDPTQALDPTAVQARLDRTDGVFHLTHTLRAGVEDIDLGYLRSDDLSTFVPMTEGIDYIVTDQIYQTPARDAIVIRLLLDPAETPRQFFRRGFSQKP